MVWYGAVGTRISGREKIVSLICGGEREVRPCMGEREWDAESGMFRIRECFYAWHDSLGRLAVHIT